MSVMHAFRSHRARRVPALIATLALFLLGSNYCVLSALSGDTRMACLTMPGDASSAAVPACHRAAPASDSHSGRPAAKPSCCPKPLLIPSSPVIESAAGSSVPVVDGVIAAVISFASPAAIDRHGQRPVTDGQAPTRLARAPAPARAPPLA